MKKFIRRATINPEIVGIIGITIPDSCFSEMSVLFTYNYLIKNLIKLLKSNEYIRIKMYLGV